MEQEELSVRQASEYSREHDTKRRGLSVSYIVRAIKEGKIAGRYVETPAVSYYMVNKASLDGYLKSERKPGVKPGSKRKAKVSQPTQTAEAPPAQPNRPAVAGDKRPPVPQETIIDREGAHITIDPLLPDLQRWMHAEAIKGDVTAWCDIRPYPDARWPGAYAVDYYYDRKDRNKKGAMGRNQEERAQALMHLLRDQLTEALQAQGWQTLTKTPSGQTLWHYRPGQQKEAQS